MPNSAFRVEGVAIEGFKAFTKRQTFEFSGRHVFLFGPNGSGKTSIVEAIRWCLFGLASRGGEIVKNQFYAEGPCIVQLTLASPDGLWMLQRRLRSSGGESDLTVRDPNGTERNLEDAFPQLSRIGPSAGTHVIYAAQQPSSRRPEADITDFRYVVYRYLGIEEIPRLAGVLLELSKDWQIQEDEICQAVDALGEQISQRISDIDNSLSRINSDPPWGSGMTPTNAETNRKIEKLASDANNLGAEISTGELNNLDPDSKLYEIDTAISLYLSRGMTDLKQKLTEKTNQHKTAESSLVRIRSAVDGIADENAHLCELRTETASVLNGSEIDELKEELRLIEADLKTSQLKLDMVRAIVRYLGTFEHEISSGLCPACDTVVELDDLKSRAEELQNTGDRRTNDILALRDRLRDRVSSVHRHARRIAEVEGKIAQFQTDISSILEEAARELDFPSQPSMEPFAEYVEDLRLTCQKMQTTVDSENETNNAWAIRIENYRQELRFQKLRGLKSRLESLYEGRFIPLHDSLKDLTEMRDVANQTRMLLNLRLKERLENDLPPVAQEMTDVYLRLTETPTFDSISIHQGENQDGELTLALHVSSSRGPGRWGLDHGILNGQAMNAIQLVPYFVFSRYQEGPLLDLLLLDDPTQAFDTRKIKLLLTELHAATSHATLFVATHEEDKFVPVLREFFDGNEIKAYKSLGINADGPQFEDVPINV